MGAFEAGTFEANLRAVTLVPCRPIVDPQDWTHIQSNFPRPAFHVGPKWALKNVVQFASVYNDPDEVIKTWDMPVAMNLVSHPPGVASNYRGWTIKLEPDALFCVR